MSTYVATGNIRKGRTITLNETLPLDDVQVHVSLSTEPEGKLHPRGSVLAEIWAGQRAR